tara:strand:- start:31 stop:261 length:231 start_codon:yes stop_codon:yes gene_type:complete
MQEYYNLPHHRRRRIDMEDFAIDVTIVVTDTDGTYITELHAKDLKDETIHAIMEDVGNSIRSSQLNEFTKAEDFLS